MKFGDEFNNIGMEHVPMSIQDDIPPEPMVSIQTEQINKSVNLVKGEKISLEKVADNIGIKLTKVLCGLGWKINRYNTGDDFDLDCQAFVCGEDRKVLNDSAFIFYNQKQGFGVTHMGDNKKGTDIGDNSDAEQIKIDLQNVPENVKYIVITVTIHEYDKRNQNFGMVSDAYIRLIDDVSGTEICRCDLSEDLSTETAIVAAEIYRHKGEWKLNPVSSGYKGGLRALALSFGVDVE